MGGILDVLGIATDALGVLEGKGTPFTPSTPSPDIINKYARENKGRIMREQNAARADYLRRQLPDDVDIDVPEYLATR